MVLPHSLSENFLEKHSILLPSALISKGQFRKELSNLLDKCQYCEEEQAISAIYNATKEKENNYALLCPFRMGKYLLE